MHKSLEEVCRSLDTLAAAVLNGWTDDRTFNETWGWQCPALNRHDLAAIPKKLADRIRTIKPDIDESSANRIKDIPKRLQVLQSSTVQYLYNGNAPQSVNTYIATMEGIAALLEPLISWQVLNDPKAMPPALSRRLRLIQSQLEEIIPDTKMLQEQIKLIQEATAAAEALPEDMQSLRKARNDIEAYSNSSQKLVDKINANAEKAESHTKHIASSRREASKIVDQCEEAHRITTSKGLAGAFDERAKELSQSMAYWVGGLAIALGAGVWIGYFRIQALSAALNVTTPHWGIIIIQIVLSIVSLGAPLWFAWLATKQVGQRFRLSEDYAYKASISKAYEGYRKEAARIDEEFESRLFGSALTRLEELPLRWIEQDTHGSPMHEFMKTDAFTN